jgi:tRNA threonylcarbamoyladenosine biosynthesis protein TsaE
MASQFTKHLPSESDLLAFGSDLAKATLEGTTIFLYGQLGAGKTTLTRGFLRGLGFTDKVKSPTYTLVEPYEINGRKLFHFDFYRLDNAMELEHIGIRDYFSPTTICLIEWPEKGFPFLPQPDLACYISFANPGRDIRLEAQTELGHWIVKQLKG